MKEVPAQSTQAGKDSAASDVAALSNASAPPAFSVQQLTLHYDKTPVLWDLTFSVPQGHLVGIIGPNGAGKSTLIRAALGLLPSFSGKIRFFNLPLSEVRNRIAYIPQREIIDWDFPLTVRELVLMGRYGRLAWWQWPSQADHIAAMECLEKVGMAAFADRPIRQLSGGQRQRIFIARALMQEADLYFLDEPFAAIDQTSEHVIMDLLRHMRAQGKTIFMVHHDLSTLKRYFDWLILLNMRLIACGPLEQTLQPELLQATFGKHDSLFDEAWQLMPEERS